MMCSQAMVLGQAWSSYSESYKANGTTLDLVVFVVVIVRNNRRPSFDCLGSAPDSRGAFRSAPDTGIAACGSSRCVCCPLQVAFIPLAAAVAPDLFVLHALHAKYPQVRYIQRSSCVLARADQSFS